MKFITAILILLACIKSSQQMCANTESCFCLDMKLICSIQNCQTTLPLQSVGVIQIYGEMCENHYEVLQNKVFGGTIIQLINSPCMDLLDNCM
jgi:hypothetical protein